jgi:hypothetical protein
MCGLGWEPGGAVEDAKKMREELGEKVVEVVRGNCGEFRTRGVEKGER